MEFTVHEARVPVKKLGGDNRSSIHSQVDGLLLAQDRQETPRNFIWGRVDDTVLIRSAQPREAFFSRIQVQTDGAIAFEFEASPKTGRAGSQRNHTRKSIQGDDRLLTWCRTKLVSCGIIVADLDIISFMARMAKCDLASALFTGTGEIVDAELFQHAFINGISGSGPKCWGFGTLIINWE